MADKKVRIGSEVDATGAQKGFDDIKKGAENMADVVKGAGEGAGEALDNGVGGGAENANKRVQRANAALNASIRRSIGATQRQLAEQASSSARGTRAYFEEYAKLRGADINKLEKNLLELEAVERRLGNTLENSTRQVQTNGFAVGNLAAQFQDIAVTAQMGMDPLMIALQQGTQISAAFGSAGAAGALSTMKAALASVISPLSLVTIGIVAAAAAAIQFISTLFKSEKEVKTLDDRISDFNDTLSNLDGNIIKNEDSMESLRKKYGQVTGEINGYIETLQKLNRIELKKQFEGIASETINAFEKEISTFFSKVDFSHGFGKFNDPAEKMQELLGATDEQAQKLAETLFTLDRAKTFETQLPALEQVYGVLSQLDMTKQKESIQGLARSISELLLKAAEYQNVVKKSVAPPKEFSDAEEKYKKLTEEVNKNILESNTLANQLSKTNRSIGDSAYQTAIFKRELELTTAAKKAGIPITAELSRMYKKLATDEAEAAKRLSDVQDKLDRTPHLGFFDAAAKGADEWVKKYEDSGKLVSTAITGAFDSATDAITEFVMTGELSIKELTKTILAEFTKIAIRSAVIQPIVGGLFPSAGAGGSAGTVASARGNAFVGGQVQAFANGGVVSTPTYFPMTGNRTGLMGEAGSEAIMPLGRDSKGRLGVRSSGGEGVNIDFQLINQSSQQLTSNQQQAFYDEDMQRFVVRAVIEDYESGGPTRNLIGER
ncbi:tail tape measure protein [Vibrio phage Vaitephage]|nr:tail tape measure protein [Vibrio phage Vaitephage]